MNTGSDIVYRLDAGDALCFANREYDEFAAANSGELATSTAVLNRPLWDFITDPTTRQLYHDLVRRVREGSSAQFNFRCDAPACRRMLEMNVALEENGRVEFRTNSLWEEHRAPQPVLQYHTTSADDFLIVCSWCNAVKVGDAWVEVEEAVKLLRLFERTLLPRLSHGVCEPCYQTMLKAMA